MDRPSEPTGELRVAAPGDLATMLMGELCGAYLRAHHEVSVRLVASNVLVDPLGEGFDIAVRVHMSELPATHELKIRRLGRVELGLYAACEYVAEHGLPRRPESLAEHAILAMAELRSGAEITRVRDGRAVALAFEPRLVSNDHYVLRDAAIAGAGIAQLPTFLAREAVDEGRLRRVLPGWTLAAGSLSLLWPAQRHLSPRVRAFIELAAEFFADW
jgi:DNA-binding transcriptional LysR family regulator